MKKVKILYNYNYYSYSIQFEKCFELDFYPFLGLTIIDENISGNVFVIELINNEYKRVNINYNMFEKEYYIEVNYTYNPYVSDESIDDNIDLMEKLNWKKIKDDSESIKKLSK